MDNSNNIADPKIPRGLRVVAGTLSSPPGRSEELSQLRQEVARIEKWWADPRWKHTTRNFSGKS